jgi:hypothetical protein
MPATKAANEDSAEAAEAAEAAVKKVPPWRFMTFWAEQRIHLTRELKALLLFQRDLPPAFAKPPSWLGGESKSTTVTLSVGNALKTLYLHLRISHLRGHVDLSLASHAGEEGFMGIQAIRVPAASRAAFDAGLFPTPWSDCSRASCFPYAHKTLQKLWQSAGFVAYQPPVFDVGDVFLRFDEALRLRLRAQIVRANTQRHIKGGIRHYDNDGDTNDENEVVEERAPKKKKRSRPESPPLLSYPMIMTTVDAASQTEPDALLTHAEVLLLCALRAMRQAQH